MVELAKEAEQLKALTTLQKFRVLDAMHNGYEVKPSLGHGVSAEDIGTLSLVDIMQKYPIFDNNFIIAICEAVKAFDVEQMEEAAEEYKSKFDLDDGHAFIQSIIKNKKGK